MKLGFSKSSTSRTGLPKNSICESDVYRMYVNGKENLLHYGKSQPQLNAMFDKSIQFKIIVRELTESRLCIFIKITMI